MKTNNKCKISNAGGARNGLRIHTRRYVSPESFESGSPPFFPRATERKTAPPWRERPFSKNILQQPLRKERTARLGRHRDRGSFRRRRTSFPTPQKRPPEPWPSSLRRGGENEIPCETVGVMAGENPEDRRPGKNR